MPFPSIIFGGPNGGTQDLGPFLRLPCFGCEAPRWFHARRHTTGFHLLRFTFFQNALLTLECAECGFEIRLAGDDADKVKKLIPLAQEVQSGALDEATFRSRVQSADLAFLKQREQAEATWTCAHCGETSPLTFSNCWSCGGSAPTIPSDDPAAPVRTVHLDQAMRHQNSPFGGGAPLG